jgi:hypothetical protein
MVQIKGMVHDVSEYLAVYLGPPSTVPGIGLP